MKMLSALVLAAAGASLALPVAHAQDAVKTTPKKTAKKAPAKEAPGTHEEDKEPDITTSGATDYNCELGNKLTIYRNAEDGKHIALRWQKRLLRLTRVETTTGANRFENQRNGWVWIDIPAKGMLLDAKKGRQLANECRNPEQMQPKAPEALKAPEAPDAPKPEATKS